MGMHCQNASRSAILHRLCSFHVHGCVLAQQQDRRHEGVHAARASIKPSTLPMMATTSAWSCIRWLAPEGDPAVHYSTLM